MAKLTSILNERFLKKEKTKTGLLAERTHDGSLTSFSGIFGVVKLDENEKEKLLSLLKDFSLNEEQDFSQDLHSLVAITSEVKAIQTQAVMLHGERIKKAQELLKKYRDGAFTSWLVATYGNRQTPYNFLKYYEFHTTISKPLQQQLETMPRQAVYTLASREGDFEKKEEIVKNYKGESKLELLSKIRFLFPLDEKDKRSENFGECAIQTLKKLVLAFKEKNVKLTKEQQVTLHQLVALLNEQIN